MVLTEYRLIENTERDETGSRKLRLSQIRIKIRNSFVPSTTRQLLTPKDYTKDSPR